MTFWKFLGWAALAAVYWWIFETADKATQVGLVLGGVMVYLYYDLSRQINENHKKVSYMLENIASSLRVIESSNYRPSMHAQLELEDWASERARKPKFANVDDA